MKKTFVILLFFVAFLSGCSKDNANDNYSPTCSGTAKSYKTDVAPLIQTYCAGCHSNYSSWTALSSSRSSVRSTIVNGSMPQGKTLTNAQKDAIICWIDNGAANN